MYLHIGSYQMISQRDIVGIFDLDTSTVETATRDYLTSAQKAGQVVDVGENLPKSFVLCTNIGRKNHRYNRESMRKSREKRQKLYISPLASVTLKMRADNSDFN